MDRWLGKHSDLFYALFRTMLGILFAFHGAQKLFGLFGMGPFHEPMMIVAGVVELGGGIMIALGILTSTTAFIASGLMAAAYFMGHAPRGFWPIVNQGELAVVYCFAFLYIASRGTVRYGVMGDGRRG